jgi:tetratricopeptide (TPR) repeat protein
MPKAKAAALKALQIDPNLAEAHASLAQILHDYDWDFAGALREIDRAIELNRNYATAHQWRAEFLSAQGRHEEAIAEAKRALELDPLSSIINRILGDAYLAARRYDEAITQYRKAIEIEPNFPSAHLELGRSYRAKGQYSEAVAEFMKSAELVGRGDISRELHDAYANGGWNGYLRYVAETSRTAKTTALGFLPGGGYLGLATGRPMMLRICSHYWVRRTKRSPGSEKRISNASTNSHFSELAPRWTICARTLGLLICCVVSGWHNSG